MHHTSPDSPSVILSLSSQKNLTSKPKRIRNRGSSLLDTNDAARSVRGEQALWRAVITQALMDAASQSSKPEVRSQRDEALHWLLHSREDFATVCHLAGLDPSYARRKAKQALARGCQWRAESAPRAHKSPPHRPKNPEKLPQSEECTVLAFPARRQA